MCGLPFVQRKNDFLKNFFFPEEIEIYYTEYCVIEKMIYRFYKVHFIDRRYHNIRGEMYVTNFIDGAVVAKYIFLRRKITFCFIL